MFSYLSVVIEPMMLMHKYGDFRTFSVLGCSGSVKTTACAGSTSIRLLVRSSQRCHTMMTGRSRSAIILPVSAQANRVPLTATIRQTRTCYPRKAASGTRVCSKETEKTGEISKGPSFRLLSCEKTRCRPLRSRYELLSFLHVTSPVKYVLRHLFL